MTTFKADSVTGLLSACDNYDETGLPGYYTRKHSPIPSLSPLPSPARGEMSWEFGIHRGVSPVYANLPGLLRCKRSNKRYKQVDDE
jgi:hypothetical protein